MKTILIIDDELAICKLLRKILEKEGYHVLEAGDGEKGLTLFKQHRCDLIITDLIMPGKEGLETIRDIRKSGSDVKIIAISGGGISDPALYLDFAKKFGAQITLSKPIDNQALLQSVKHLLPDN
jgi:CheY-like chemotaxis protein